MRAKQSSPARGAPGPGGVSSGLNCRFRTPNKPRDQQRWAAAIGGNRLGRLQALLVGDANTVQHLPDDSPRKTPTRPRLRCLEQEDAR